MGPKLVPNVTNSKGPPGPVKGDPLGDYPRVSLGVESGYVQRGEFVGLLRDFPDG